MRGRPPLPSLAIIALAAAALALVVLGQGAGAAIEFEGEPTPIPLKDTGSQTDVVMAAGPDDTLYAAWVDDRYTSIQQGVTIIVSWSMTDDRGRAWRSEVDLTKGDPRNDAAAPAISVGPDGVVHVVWQELQVVDDAPGGPYWEVRYAYSIDHGESWEDIRVSQPNNRNNTRPDVVGLSGAKAYVAWDLEDHPGSSISLAYIEQGSRAWIREDFAEASTRWEINSHVSLGVGADGQLHAAWQAVDMDAMWEPLASQVLYSALEMAGRETAFPEPVPLADEQVNVTNEGPALVVTKRHGSWVAWVVEAPAVTGDSGTTVLADQVVEGVPGVDVVVATFATVPGALPTVDGSLAPDDGAALAIAWVGSPTTPPQFTSTCSEQGCFAQVLPVVPGETPAATRTTVTMDGLGNVYVGWDDGKDVFCTQRRNNPPGPPELQRPDRATNAGLVEFVWSFNDVDAGASQSGFEINYSMDQSFPEQGTMGGQVLGAQGRSSRYVATEEMEEGRWYWKVRTRDQLGLWSGWPLSDLSCCESRIRRSACKQREPSDDGPASHVDCASEWLQHNAD